VLPAFITRKADNSFRTGGLTSQYTLGAQAGYGAFDKLWLCGKPWKSRPIPCMIALPFVERQPEKETESPTIPKCGALVLTLSVRACAPFPVFA
jgi:hypothetical protein